MSALTPGAAPARRIDIARQGTRRLLWAATSALFLLLLSSLFGAPDVSVPAVALLALAGLAAYRPASGLLTIALLLPIASWLGRTWNGTVVWPETVAVAYLAGYAARKALEGNSPPGDALARAIGTMIAVIAGSLAIELLFLHATIGGPSLQRMLWQLVSRDYFIGDGGFDNADAAMRFIEGLLLAHAGAACARTDPTFGPRLVRALVIGAAVAGTLTLWRIWQGAVRTETPVVTFLRYLGTIRFNTHYADVNAAGSYYVMALLPALALAVSRARWLSGAAIIVLSLTLTGSRAAYLAAPVALAIAWFLAYARPTAQQLPHPGRIRLVAAALIVAGGVAMFFAGNARNATPIQRALQLRKEFTLTSLRMAASRPFFGVGIGEYWHASAEFTSPQLRAVYPNENAHNNFLQILAEVGIVGFAVFVGLLVLAARQARRLVFTSTPRVAIGAVAGALAFLLTSVSGHPLLVDEAALMFWVLLGTITGWGLTASSGGTLSAPGRWLMAVVLMVVVLSIPTRTQGKLDSANLEHVGVGLSRWHTSRDQVRYRLAMGAGTVFVPAVSVISVPLRLFAPEGGVDVQLLLDGRHVNSIRVTSAEWRTVPVPLPHPSDGPRFRALHLKVLNSDSAILMIGKVEPH